MIFSLISISDAFFLVDCTSCLFMWMCTRVALIDLSKTFLMRLPGRSGCDLRNTYLVKSGSLVLVGMNIAAWQYLAGSVLVAWSITFFTIAVVSYLCSVFDLGNYYMPVWLLLYTLNIFCPLFWTSVYFCSSVMVQPSSHRTINCMGGAVLISVKMWIFLASLDIIVSVNVCTCVDYLVFPYVSLSDMVCFHLIGVIVFDTIFSKYVLASESYNTMLVLKVSTWGV